MRPVIFLQNVNFDGVLICILLNACELHSIRVKTTCNIQSCSRTKHIMEDNKQMFLAGI